MDLPIENIESAKVLPQELFKTVNFKLPGGYTFSPTYIQAGLIVLLLFLLILTLGSLRHRYTNWTIKGVMPGVTFGFVLALFIEALLIASGSTIFISLLGWKNPPKPISTVLDSGKTKLVKVLGESDQAGQSDMEMSSEEVTIGKIMSDYKELNMSEQESLKTLLCPH